MNPNDSQLTEEFRKFLYVIQEDRERSQEDHDMIIRVGEAIRETNNKLETLSGTIKINAEKGEVQNLKTDQNFSNIVKSIEDMRADNSNIKSEIRSINENLVELRKDYVELKNRVGDIEVESRQNTIYRERKDAQTKLMIGLATSSVGSILLSLLANADKIIKFFNSIGK